MILLNTLGNELYINLKYGPIKYDTILNELYKKYPKTSSGAYRTTFSIDRKWVLKVPSKPYPDEMKCNIIEYISYNHRKDLPLAKCDLFMFHSLPVIIMERVRIPEKRLYVDLPSFGLDAKRQMGTKLGNKSKLLCYDYGNEEHLYPDLNDNVMKNVLNAPQLPDNIPEYMKLHPIKRKDLWK